MPVDCVFSQRRENVKNDEPSREIKRQQTVFIMKVKNTRDFYSGSAPIVGNSLIHLEFVIYRSILKIRWTEPTEFLLYRL